MTQIVPDEAQAQASYTWSGASGQPWSTAGNWTPPRTAPAANDIIVFDGAVTAGASILSVPSEVIGRLRVINGAVVSLFGLTPGPSTVTLGGGTGADLEVLAGCSLNLQASGSATFQIQLATGTSGLVAGTLRPLGLNAQFLATDPGALVLSAGSLVEYSNAGFPFGTTSAGSVVFQSGSVYRATGGFHDVFGAASPSSVVIFAAGSLYRLQSNTLPPLSGRTFANLEVNSPSLSSTPATGSAPFIVDHLTILAGTPRIAVTDVRIRGNVQLFGGGITFNPSSAQTVDIDGPSAQILTRSGGSNWSFNNQSHLRILNPAGVTLSSGNLSPFLATIQSGSKLVVGAGPQASLQNNGTLTVQGTLQLDPGALPPSGAPFAYASGSHLVFANSGPLTLSNLACWPPSAGPTHVSLVGGGPVSLPPGNSRLLNGTLTLTNGVLDMGGAVLTVGAAGGIVGGSAASHVRGSLARTMAVSGTPQSRAYPVGDATTYTPVVLDFPSMSAGGTITISSSAGDHASITSSGLISTKSVNRTWSVTNGGASFAPASASFTFAPGDVDPGANPLAFGVSKFAASTWTSLAATAQTATSVTAMGIASFSDFQIGEPLPPCGSSLSFFRSDYGAGIGPLGLAAADFDGDDDFDIATADYGGHTVSVLHGNGSGGLTLGSSLPAGVNPVSIDIGDVSGDGSLDLVVANWSSHTVSEFRGNGTGSFLPPVDVYSASGSRPIAGRLGRLDAGLTLDLFLPQWSYVQAVALPGNGLGSFGPATAFATGDGPYDAALGDLDGDGDLDAVVANRGRLAAGTTISVLLGNGAGGFAAPVHHTVSTNPQAVALGDLDGDGNLDVAVANNGGNTISILLGDGSGGLGPQTQIATVGAPVDIAIGDVNADGRSDLVVADQSSSAISVFRANCAGGYVREDFPAHGRPNQLVLIDMDQNGSLDIVAANSDSNSVSVFRIGVTPPTTYLVTGQAFNDRNGNGIFEPSLLPLPETGLRYRTVQSLDPAGNVLASMQTDSLGEYSLAIACGLPYRVRVLPPPRWTYSAPPLDGIHSGPAAPCGTSIAVAKTANVPPPCVDSIWTYTTETEFEAEQLDGVVANGDQLELPDIPTSLDAIARYAWIANSGEGTVSKVNALTGKEEGRYYSGPLLSINGQTMSPARVVVDRDGNCWVANRTFWGQGSVTQILAYPVDRDGDGVIETSTDHDKSGVIKNADELLDWGYDEAVVRHYGVGMSNGTPRAIAIDGDDLWVGLWGEHRLVRVSATLPNAPGSAYAPHPTNPTVVAPELQSVELTIETGGGPRELTPYGIVPSCNGKLYLSTLSQFALEVDPGTEQIRWIDHQRRNYGIAVDKQGVVWLAARESMVNGVPAWDGCVRWDPTEGTGDVWRASTGTTGKQGRGIAVDLAGDIWMALDGSSVARYSPSTTPSLVGTFSAGVTTPVGVGIGADGNLIVVGKNSNNWSKINVSNGNEMTTVGPRKVGLAPYTYSDFTGAVALGLAPQQGTWTALTDGNTAGYIWHTVSWNGSTPANTSIQVEARAYDKPSTAGLWLAVPLAQPLVGRFIETRVRLTGSRNGCDPTLATPVFYDLTVEGQCDSCSVNCPPDFVIPCTSPAGAVFFYELPAPSGFCDPIAQVGVTHPSGTQFPIGTTLVTYHAFTSSGEFIECDFTVTVTDSCVLLPNGCCCKRGSNAVMTEGECLALGGIYLGDGSTCGLSVTNDCSFSCVRAPDGMRAWWPLDVLTGEFTPNLADPGVAAVRNGGVSLTGGRVQNGMDFDGNEFLLAPDASSVDLGHGNFSIDAWVKTTSMGFNPILDKREPDAANVQGYHLYLQDGFPGLQLAVGGQTFNFGVNALVATGEWVHLAVTVGRSLSNGLQFYVDGSPAGAALNPTAATGNLDTSRPLLIGARQPYISGTTYFTGQLDEIEIFKRRLRADEVLRIYQGDAAGKCREACHVKSMTSLLSANPTTLGLTICNYSSDPVLYSWSITPSLGPNCTSVHLSTFSPSTGTIPVPVGGCVTIPIAPSLPTSVGAGESACFTASIFNHETGQSFGCVGSLRRPKWWHLDWKLDFLPLQGPVVLSGLDPRGVVLQVFGEPLAELPTHFRYRLRAVASDDSISEVVSINGLLPGVVSADSVMWSPGTDSLSIPFTLAYTAEQPLGFDRIVVEAEDGVTGVYEVVAVLGIRNAVTPSAVTGVDPPKAETENPAPGFIGLPNPFSESTEIRFRLPATDRVTLVIYDLNGRVLSKLLDGALLEPGEHSVRWSGRDAQGQAMAPGVYFTRLESSAGTSTAKLVLQR